MAASVRCALRRLRTTAKGVTYRSLYEKGFPRLTKIPSATIKTGGVLFAQAVAISLDDTNSGNNKLKGVDPANLTSSYLIRNAAAASVDSVTTLLTQTAATLIETHEKYSATVDQLVALQQAAVEIHGQPHQEERVWEALLVVRKKLADVKAAKQELEIVFSSVERLVNNAAEAAFLAGADHACTVANERIFAAQEKLSAASKRSLTAEDAMRKHEAWVISETTRRDKDLKTQTPDKPQTRELEPQVEFQNPETEQVSPEILGENSQHASTTESGTTNTATDGDDWFSVILEKEDEKEDLEVQRDTEDFGDREDERKWANAK